MTKQITVHYYSNGGTTIVRTRTYTTRAGAERAMARARKRGVISAFAGNRTASDSPTCHH